jgi:class 3 adenylate cyclase/pimeloyl-ACP methyl ester carboxylesterase
MHTMGAVDIPDTHYARTADGVYIAYKTVGDGSIDLVWQLDIFGNVDLVWEYPIRGTWLQDLEFARVIVHDRRGTGLSSRNVPPPNLETRVADLRAVLDAVGSRDPILGGGSEGGAVNALFAATDPDRVRSLIWYGPTARMAWAPDYPWGVGPDYFEREQRALELWGTNEYGQAFADMEATIGHIVGDEVARRMAMITRQTTTPDVAKELARTWYETDVRGVLPSVQVPTLLVTHDALPADVEEMEYVASLILGAKTVAVPGENRKDNFGPVCDAIRDFVGAERPPRGLDTILSTVLFTDIVGSTERLASLGDHGWKELVERHHAVVRAALERWRGVENDTAGDGFYATFDGPARAIHCALEISQRVKNLGLEVRAGVHTGECELIDGKLAGIAVATGSRIASLAETSEVLVSQTVKDLVAGSGLTFEDLGEHELKGIPGNWRLYRVGS